jgi:hypothetical protein
LRTPLGHDLKRISTVAIGAFKLNPLPPAVASELTVLNSLYKTHLLRYGSIYDVLVDPATIRSDRTMRRICAAIRLAERATPSDDAV